MSNRILGPLAFAALAAAAFVRPASAAVLFDSEALGEPLCAAGAICADETREADANNGAVLKFSADVTISRIGVWAGVDQAQDIKFLIFDSSLNGGTGNLLFSQEDHFAQNDTEQFIFSAPMSFTFHAGRTYDVGVLGDGASLTTRWIFGQNLSAGPVTEIARNANFNDFNAPTTGVYSGVAPFIQLDTGVVTAPAPEPATWGLMIAGLGLAGAALRRRRAALAAA